MHLKDQKSRIEITSLHHSKCQVGKKFRAFVEPEI